MENRWLYCTVFFFISKNFARQRPVGISRRRSTLRSSHVDYVAATECRNDRLTVREEKLLRQPMTLNAHEAVE